MIDPVCQPRAARHVKGETEEGSAGESREGLADGSGACKNLIPLINQMKLFTAACWRYAWKPVFQVRLLGGDQLEPLPAISPVDPPGQTLSEPSVAVVDDYNFSIVHPDRLPAGTERRGAFPGAH